MARLANMPNFTRISMDADDDGFSQACLTPSCQTYRLSKVRETLSHESFLEWFKSSLDGDEPFLVSRFGTTEIRSAWRSVIVNEGGFAGKFVALLTKLEPPFWMHRMFRNLSLKAGYYPIDRESVDWYTRLLVSSMKDIDVLGSWEPGEAVFQNYMPDTIPTAFNNLNPIRSDNPWTKWLGGKRVLVVHPFKETIERQYEVRTELFEDPEFLPEFDLRVVRAAQTRGETGESGKSWQEHLQDMVDESLSAPFDIAIVGCGSYGVPLGSELKRAGRKVMHLGGPTQLLFGIKGKRWDQMGIYTPAWVRPSESEKPANPSGLGPSPYW